MGITIKLSGPALQDLESLRQDIAPERINPRIGAAVQRLVVDHLTVKESEGNKNGWPSQHFYAGAARATSFSSSADVVTITISQQGFRQRVEGGDIKAVNVTYLTIPARSEAYGRRAREFGNLKMIFGRRSDGSIGPVAIVADVGGATIKVFGRREASGQERPVKGAEEGVVMYWLKKEVHQNPDRSVLPSDDEILSCAAGAITACIELTRKRQ